MKKTDEDLVEESNRKKELFLSTQIGNFCFDVDRFQYFKMILKLASLHVMFLISD